MLCLSGPSADLHLEDDKGLNLFDAPDMGESLFIGREAEFQDMESILQPQSDSPDLTRKVLILDGMGGIGKTQLASWPTAEAACSALPYQLPLQNLSAPASVLKPCL